MSVPIGVYDTERFAKGREWRWKSQSMHKIFNVFGELNFLSKICPMVDRIDGQ